MLLRSLGLIFSAFMSRTFTRIPFEPHGIVRPHQCDSNIQSKPRTLLILAFASLCPIVPSPLSSPPWRTGKQVSSFCLAGGMGDVRPCRDLLPLSHLSSVSDAPVSRRRRIKRPLPGRAEEGLHLPRGGPIPASRHAALSVSRVLLGSENLKLCLHLPPQT